ncbi:MAG: stage 0 sporulation family protein [Dethiobacter sp.]|jgi:cell fate regulator YaaT (PSP1 superfamily)|nr:stage 0 sporulation family protein [Dethiobacter sp.]
MPRVIGVRFRRAGKTYFFDPAPHQLALGDMVIVETVRGQEIGEIASCEKEVAESEVFQPLKKVIRVATEADLRQEEENKRRESEAYQKCLVQIERHKLNMKLVGVEYAFDRSKIIFYFTSEERVDFRELVKDLASVFKTRIELRQIGVRDEAKLIGGFGPCGRSFCCASFLEEFQPVSIRMAKGQNLSLNPTKISGVCGRLMCCLRFEMNSYDEARDEQFSIGEIVITPDGDGLVEKVYPSKKVVLVKLREAKSVREFPLEEVGRP